jgi:NitT/TauT family transport system permease protein
MRLRSLTACAAFYAAVLVLWATVARSGPWPAHLFPGPLEVLSALVDGLQGGLFVRGALVSLYRAGFGFGVSVILGVGLGLLLGRVRLLDDTLGSLVRSLQPLPSICWLPLALLWFGLDERAVIFVVVMGAVLSITLGVEAGVKDTPAEYLRAARNLGASGLALYTQVIFPAAKPAVLSSLRQGWSSAWRSLMAAELLFYSLGLGSLLQAGRELNDAARIMAVMLVIIALAVAVDRLVFAPAERRLRERWGLALG